jgi:hypothetical protein
VLSNPLIISLRRLSRGALILNLISQLANEWPPAAAGSARLFGGEYCLGTGAGLLKRALAVGASVALIYECNRKQLQSSVLFKDEELAQQVADLFMQHQGERLEELGKLEVHLGTTR